MQKKAMMKKVGSVYASDMMMNRLCSEPHYLLELPPKKDYEFLELAL